MNIFSKITAKTMQANRVRTVVTIIGVILSTSMITAVATFGTSFQSFLVDYRLESALMKENGWDRTTNIWMTSMKMTRHLRCGRPGHLR